MLRLYEWKDNWRKLSMNRWRNEDGIQNLRSGAVPRVSISCFTCDTDCILLQRLCVTICYQSTYYVLWCYEILHYVTSMCDTHHIYQISLTWRWLTRGVIFQTLFPWVPSGGFEPMNFFMPRSWVLRATIAPRSHRHTHSHTQFAKNLW